MLIKEIIVPDAMTDYLVIKGAREHNLKNISLSLPKNKFIVITGLSGSGKSTLAFDTIYAEGQRRYVESLSAYARQFLGLMNKPDVDSIEGLSPAISIEQKTTSKNPRSTVGTVTEIYDYYRLLFARIGIAHCPLHNLAIKQRSADSIAEEIVKANFKEVMVLAPIIRQKKGTYEAIIKELYKEGFTKARVNKTIVDTSKPIKLDRYKKHDIEIVIDSINGADKSRINEAIELALKKADGLVYIIADDKESAFSAKMACPKCGLSIEELQPRMFSFNSPFGACEECHGLGFKHVIDTNLVIPDKDKSIADGAILAYKNMVDGWRTQQLASVARANEFSLIDPIKKLTKKQYNVLMYGSEKEVKFSYNSKDSESYFQHKGTWEGVVPQLMRLYHQTESDYRKQEIEKFMRQNVCSSCKGKKLKDKVLAVKINRMNIIELTDLSIIESIKFFKTLKISPKEQMISKQVLKEINSRLGFLQNVGLGYLTLSRSAGTLSGGESQRIRLATQIGSNLTGVLYVLDEPSIGLHQKDNHKLIETLHNLRDLKNTLIVVEHDEDTVRKADYVVDMGPGAGIHGGRIVAQGTPEQILKNKKSLTGQYLSGKKRISVPKRRRRGKSNIVVRGARQHNLKNIDVMIPTGVLTLITGVSGSGKSTLVHDILYRELMKRIYKSTEEVGLHKSIDVPKEVDKVIMIDQSPIGRTPRSNPVTYIGVFDEIRKLYASLPESKINGFGPGRYSFNVQGGRCEVCNGDGLIKIEMNFLPDVFVPCDECKAKRYNSETLAIKYKDKNISEVLDMSVEEALGFFSAIPRIERKLTYLNEVGLGYIKLGQSSTTLSGGEAQRIKLTKELSKKATGNTLYLLDEPTTGLHSHDVNKLLIVLSKLVDKGNSVIVIEHNLDVIKTADHIIDLGPEGGDRGGYVVAKGTPEEIAENRNSETGKFLKKLL